jgi:hypothetical protein
MPMRLPAIIQPARLNYSPRRKKSRGRTTHRNWKSGFTVPVS